MPTQFGTDLSRLPLAGMALLSAALLSVGCAGKSPLAFLKPQPAASKPQPAASKKADPKPAAAPIKTASKKADPKKTQPRPPEQPASAPLGPSDRLGPGYWIQLAAHFKARGGEAAWKTLSARHPGLLGGEAHAIKRVDLGEKGRFYRLVVGPYAARRPAREKCARLKRARVACFVITRYGRTRGTPVAGAPKTIEPKPPATAFPAAAVKPGKPDTPRNAAVTATPALVKPPPRPPAKTAEKKTGTPAAERKRAADLPFQRSDSIPGVTK